MSSRQRKRPGGAADSRPARKRSRLQPSSATGTSQEEPVELVASGTPALEPAAGPFTDLTSQSSETEFIVFLSDDEPSVDREQSQEQPHLSRESGNSAEPQARHDEEEPREDDGAWPAGPASPPGREDEDSEVQDSEQTQQYPHGSRDTEDSTELWASDDEEEATDNDSAWTENVIASPNWKDDNPEEGEESQPYSRGSRASENADEVPANENEEEPQDIELRPSGSLLCVICRSCYSQLHEVYEQQSRNSTLNSCQQLDGSGHGTGADDGPVAGSGPTEEAASEEGAARSDAKQGVIIRCPICMDCYSEIVQSGRQLVATMCGHLFCSECLPVALETVGTCPTCRMELTPDLYFPIYI